ncbi:MAG: hypothetical protein F4Z55_04985 [Boseongicola sp. SB0667_bin_21]|nr:hypothetical protein [Boseongicola sp. SB0667_bin_21]
MTASEWLFLKDLVFLGVVGVVVFFVVFGCFDEFVSSTWTSAPLAIALAAFAALGAAKIVSWAVLGW